MPPLDQPPLLALAKKCHYQLGEIEFANTRIIERGRAGLDGLWGRMLNEAYNPTCKSGSACNSAAYPLIFRADTPSVLTPVLTRREGNRPADAFLDVICPDTDLKAVCDRKWELGETLGTYRTRLSEFVPLPAEHDELELLIRRSVIQEDRSPTELDGAVKQSIAAAKRVIRHMPRKIFLNYRRSDGWPASRVYERLQERFLPPDDVFIDIYDDNIPPGLPWATLLKRKVTESDLMLVLIGSIWVAEFEVRSDPQQDWVRREIESALAHKIIVMPVLLDDTLLPSPESLPESIRPILSSQAEHLRRARFKDDIERLIDGLIRSIEALRND